MARVSPHYPERIVPDEVPPGILALHLARYEFARRFCAGRVVLDMACGVGYGARHLAGTATRVIAGDIDLAAARRASRDYSAPHLSYLITDCGAIALAGRIFDVVCSFETIEHLPDAESYLAEVVRLLKPNGIFVVSTPNARKTTTQPDNPFHRQEWSAADFSALLTRYFDQVTLHGQVRREPRIASLIKRVDVFKLRARVVPIWLTRKAAGAVGTRTVADLVLDDVAIVEGELRHATEIVAVGRGPRG